MSEIKDKVKVKIDLLVRARKELDYDDYCIGFNDYGLANEILSIPELAIVDREAKVPQREKLAEGALLLQAQDKNDIYLNGQLFAQEKMLGERWAKEVTDG